VPHGAIFHGQSKRRREVEFTAALREETECAVRRLHSLIAARALPAAEVKPQCDGCSLREVCMPELKDLLPAAAERVFAGDD
jgi:CRISPR-associated exonuclease Cas4